MLNVPQPPPDDPIVYCESNWGRVLPGAFRTRSEESVAFRCGCSSRGIAEPVLPDKLTQVGGSRSSLRGPLNYPELKNDFLDSSVAM
ncbi:hypothetical protein MRX96_013976 [Rhipicephalus microplus]